jgi:glycosyltransferase involved in cell wall biosynthesis
LKGTGNVSVTRRIALLTNFLPHYRLPLLESLQQLVGNMRIFLSAKMEQDRNWQVFWGSLDVVLQKSFTFTHYFRNVHGYRDWSNIHIPYDTYTQLRRYDPEVIISGELGMRTAMSALYRIFHPKTKLILWATLSEHTEATRGMLRRIIRHWIMLHIDAAFVNGNSGARYLAKIGFSGPLFTIPYVINNDAFAGESTVRDDGVLRLLYVGQLIERKGVSFFLSVLIKWCRDNPDRSILLHIAGNGPEREKMNSVSLPQNLQVKLLGEFDPNELPACYHGASIFIFPTLGDEWGTVVNEALSAGLPVLGSIYSQAVEELVSDGNNGWIFNPFDTQATYCALDRAMRTEYTMLQEMSENARASIAKVTPAVVAKIIAGAVNDIANHTDLHVRS